MEKSIVVCNASNEIVEGKFREICGRKTSWKKRYCSVCGKQLELVYGEGFDENTGERKTYLECPMFTIFVDDYFSAPRTQSFFQSLMGEYTVHNSIKRGYEHDSDRKFEGRLEEMHWRYYDCGY
jgi:hypothetical protein